MDLNGDGYLDLLSGSYAAEGLPKMAGLFQVLWGEKGGTFQIAEPLKGLDDKPLTIITVKNGRRDETERICTRPTAVDWDGDGDLDLVVGNFSGTFYLFKGGGKGKFEPKSELLMVKGRALKLHDDEKSDPFFVDWDGDGDLDLLSGSKSGSVVWARNDAGVGQEISLTDFQVILPPSETKESWLDLPKKPSSSTRVWADDLNGDGKIDLIVGDKVTMLRPSKGKTKEEAQELLIAWEKKISQVLDDDKKIEPNSKEGQMNKNKFFEIAREKDQIVEEKTSGFVWIYLRK